MQKAVLRLFILWLALLLAIAAKAQVCTGSLGDPVINESFGFGINPGPPSSYSYMKYTSSNCPNDGEYTLINSLNDSTNCHIYTWFNVPTDHTGNKNGYMMLINASY